MIPFRVWFENKNIRDTVLALLGLDEEGAANSLASFDPETLIKKFEPLGFWQSLTDDKKQEATSLIKSKRGTISDLIEVLSKTPGTDIDYSLNPPREDM
jgi:hypothetical protein